MIDLSQMRESTHALGDDWQRSSSGLYLPEGLAPRRRPTAIDFFCGCGGFSLGMLAAGFEVVAAVDNDETCMMTYMTYRITPAETLLLVLAMIALLVGLTIVPARSAQPGQVIRITAVAHADLAIEGSSWPRPVYTSTRWRLVRDPLLPEAAPKIETDHTLDGQRCRILVYVGQGWTTVEGLWTDVRDLVYVGGSFVRVDQHSRAIGQASYEDYLREREGD